MRHPKLQVEAISLDQPKPGFRDFIGTWLVRQEQHTILVDPGPSRTIPYLVEQLQQRGISQLDGVLLTHIHIDHAGGIGHLVHAIPTGWVQCHSRALPHVADPTRLWKGSLKVLGELPYLYGPIHPVPESQLQSKDKFSWRNVTIEVVDTPGHAPHHQSFFLDSYLFSGEAAGVVTPEIPERYLRPATPPKFIPSIFLASMDRLLQHPRLPKFICYGHFGQASNAAQRIQLAKAQILRWMEHIEPIHEQSNEAIFDSLLQHDPLFSPFRELPSDIQERETYFVTNSIRGMKAHFQDQTPPPR